MRNCSFCKNPIRPLAEWKGNNGWFYCSEFCADAGDTNEPLATSSAPRGGRPKGAIGPRCPAPLATEVLVEKQ
jgi:hypothetical protein